MSTMAKRQRRNFTPEFKAEAVKLVKESGKTVTAVARELDLTVSALRAWVMQSEVDAGRGPSGALSTAEKDELAELRKEVRTLRMERDFLKNYRAFARRSVGPETPERYGLVHRGERPSAFW